MSDILLVSGELVRYQIVERLDVDDFPPKVDGYKYDAQTYLNVVRGVSRPYMPQEADYHAIIERFNILERVATGEIDEVWIFNFPHAGFYESIMGGPGAFWCNAPRSRRPKHPKGVSSSWVFPTSAGLGKCSRTWGTAPSPSWKRPSRLPEDQNLWKRFIRHEKTSSRSKPRAATSTLRRTASATTTGTTHPPC
jgi:hypothetical protein